MDKRHIGKDLAITVTINTNGEATDLSGRDLRVEIIPPMPHRGLLVLKDYTTDSNTLTAVFKGTQQRHLGVHWVRVWENYGKTGQTVADYPEAFELVASSKEEAATTESGDLTTSATEISAIELTVGIAGPQGKPLTYDDLTAEQIAALQKPATDAAAAATTAVNNAVESANTAISNASAEATTAISNANTQLQESLDSVTLMQAALAEIFRSGGTAHATSSITVSGKSYYYDPTAISLQKGDVLCVTCQSNQGTIILGSSKTVVASSGASTECEYKATSDCTVYIGTVGQHTSGCAYSIRKIDGIIDQCIAATAAANAAAASYQTLADRVAALEAALNNQ